MKKVVIFFLFVIYCQESSAQLYGAQWMLGPNTSRMDFRNDTVVNDSIRLWMNTHLTNADICDSTGNLLFYTNGIYVADGNTGDSILNGNGLSPCLMTSQDGANGLPFIQGAIFLPMPGNDRYVYLFHFSGDIDVNTRPGTLYYSIIDRDGNGGLGAIISKNVIFFKGDFGGGGMTACKHGNGQDWWIVMHDGHNENYYTFLLTENGISDTLTQSIGPPYNTNFNNSSAIFSPDGSKYACGAFVGLITVMDFDRCTGEFSNPITISHEPKPANISGTGPLAFSPSGRFLYLTDRLDLTQYDLWNSNIQDSVEIYRADSTDYAQIEFVSLAINGKIYGSTWNGGFEYLHVVNYPDSLGHSCGFVRGGQPTLSVNSTNLPNMPNYMLGPLTGSSCDTITAIKDIASNYQLRCQPNPANKFLYVEMNAQGNYLLELVDMTGKAVAVKDTRQVDVFDTENLSNGVYLLNVIDKHNADKMLSKEIVVQH